MLSLYVDKGCFLLTNSKKNHSVPFGFEKVNNFIHIYGYAFQGDFIFKNEDLKDKSFSFISGDLIKASGIFCALKFEDNHAILALDPLCQYNIFYKKDIDCFYISNSIDCIKNISRSTEVNRHYIYDQLAYQSIIRSNTILEDVHYLNFDDINKSEMSSSTWKDIALTQGLKIVEPDYSLYDDLSYDELLRIYITRINNRARVISKFYDEVHVQLTGGADSRLTTSCFLPYSNVRYYVYGDGKSQNRLVYEHIVDALDLKRSSPAIFAGQLLINSSRIFRGISDSNYLKLNNLNTYMNGIPKTDKKVCKITGYYGANVSGGVGIPPENTALNPRLSQINPDLFTYHEYVKSFKSVNFELRRCALYDLFYINNRGKSHYAAHSIADNLSCDSFDLLYDYINVVMVRLCPYLDDQIDKNAISVDLIHMNSPQLAMFPYDDRIIPKYRNFDHIPIINCFDGYKFEVKGFSSLEFSRPEVDDNQFLIEKFSFKNLNLTEIYNHSAIRNAAKYYPDLEYLLEKNDIQASIFINFLLSCIYLDLA